MTKTEALERSSAVDENGNHTKWTVLDDAWPTSGKVSKARRQFALLNKKFAVSAEPARASADGAALKRCPKTDAARQLIARAIQENDFLRNLDPERIAEIIECMEEKTCMPGECIIREGEIGDCLYVSASGKLQVSRCGYLLRHLQRGTVFGELAILYDCTRTASVMALTVCKMWVLSRRKFQQITQLLGMQQLPMRTLREYDQNAATARAAKSAPDARFAHLQRHHLNRIATLGTGGYSRVELVCIGDDLTRTYALKSMKKRHIVDTRQQEHVFSERNILADLKTEWVVKLYRTFSDSKYVYMLLEACLGGELWTKLRDCGHFDDLTARFYVGCVVEALEYLHGWNIVYRDLKPENCLLDAKGYLKLTDFGFAKKLSMGRKTWTFCGTPEYVSPEIIMNKGHDRTADYWSLGIYICELLFGRPPFQTNEPMQTYTLILQGVDSLQLPNKRVGIVATSLVKALCRNEPYERLGSGAGGLDDVRNHGWFAGFDWHALQTRAMIPPILPNINSPTDTSNFDLQPLCDEDAPDETSGWDKGF